MRKFLLLVASFLLVTTLSFAGFSYGYLKMEMIHPVSIVNGQENYELANFKSSFGEGLVMDKFIVSCDSILDLSNPRLVVGDKEFVGVVKKFDEGGTTSVQFFDTEFDLEGENDYQLFVDIGDDVIANTDCFYDMLPLLEGEDVSNAAYIYEEPLTIDFVEESIPAEDVLEISTTKLPLPSASDLDEPRGNYPILKVLFDVKFEGLREIEINSFKVACYDFWSDLDSEFEVYTEENYLMDAYRDDEGRNIYILAEVNEAISLYGDLTYYHDIALDAWPFWIYECGIEEIDAVTEDGEKVIFSDAFMADLKADADKQRIFPDVAVEEYVYPFVNELALEGVVNGYPDRTFQPHKDLNRAEFLKIVLEDEYGEVPDTDEVCFPDAIEGEWYNKYLCFGKQEGIVVGDDQGNFNPGNSVNVVEALKITFETAGSEEFEAFEVDPGGEWYDKYVEFAKSVDLFLVGFTHGLDKHVSRGEMAELISKLHGLDESQI